MAANKFNKLTLLNSTLAGLPTGGAPGQAVGILIWKAITCQREPRGHVQHTARGADDQNHLQRDCPKAKESKEMITTAFMKAILAFVLKKMAAKGDNARTWTCYPS
jgi:hypothetical protein